MSWIDQKVKSSLSTNICHCDYCIKGIVHYIAISFLKNQAVYGDHNSVILLFWPWNNNEKWKKKKRKEKIEANFKNIRIKWTGFICRGTGFIGQRTGIIRRADKASPPADEASPIRPYTFSNCFSFLKCFLFCAESFLPSESV